MVKKMTLTYIDEKELGSYKLLRETHTNNSTIYIINSDTLNKIIIKKPHNPTQTILQKLIYLSQTDNLPITYPTHIITQNDTFYSFIMNFINEKSFDTLENLTNKQKIEYLLKAKEKLEILHKNGIIHGDIRTSNVLAPNNPIFCNIDDCIIPELGLDIEKPNYFYQTYLKQVGSIDKNLDKYEFNIMTYCFMNNIRSPYLMEYKLRRSIEINDFGVFKNKKDIKTIKRLLTFKDSYQDDYLIDSLKDNL